MTATVTTLSILFVFGVLYAVFVRWLRTRYGEHGYTAFLVVGGNAAITAGFGILAGAEMAVLLLFCMAAAGIPMIVEYGHWHLQSEAERKARDAIKDAMGGLMPQKPKVGGYKWGQETAEALAALRGQRKLLTRIIEEGPDRATLYQWIAAIALLNSAAADRIQSLQVNYQEKSNV